MARFQIIIENADGNYSAYSPDLPGCIATGRTVEETERNMRAAIQMHVEGLLEDGLPLFELQNSVVDSHIKITLDTNILRREVS